MTFASTICAVSKEYGTIIENPTAKDLRTASSIHVLTFSSKGDVLVNESEGTFDFSVWEDVFKHSEQVCRGAQRIAGDGEDLAMSEQGGLEAFMRDVVSETIDRDQNWADGLA